MLELKLSVHFFVRIKVSFKIQVMLILWHPRPPSLLNWTILLWQIAGKNACVRNRFKVAASLFVSEYKCSWV